MFSFPVGVLAASGLSAVQIHHRVSSVHSTLRSSVKAHMAGTLPPRVNKHGLCPMPRTTPEPNTVHGKTVFSVSCDPEGGQAGGRSVFRSEDLSGIQGGWRPDQARLPCRIEEA